MRKVVVGVVLLSLVAVAFAEEIGIPLTGTIIGDITLPNTVNFGTVRIGEAPRRLMVIQINNQSTGLLLNLTITNDTMSRCKYNIIEPNSVIHLMEPSKKLSLAVSTIGNYTVEAVCYTIGYEQSTIKVEYDKNLTEVHRV